MLTQHNDNFRTGATLAERILSPQLLRSGQFGRITCQAVDDEIYAQPLYVDGATIGSPRIDLLVVATMNNSVYAFDVRRPGSPPRWHRNVNAPDRNVGPVPVDDLGRTTCRHHDGAYRDIARHVGILSTPVIDLPERTVFFVARTKENGAHVQRLHALDLLTGADRPGSPVRIAADILGMGPREGQILSFDGRVQNQRAALTLHDGLVYVAWGSHCDEQPFHGWILGYDARTLRRRLAYNTTPAGRGGGIWQSGQGMAVDEEGFLYAVTGNGTADLGRGPDRGQSFIKLRNSGNGLIVEDWFTPHDFLHLLRDDRDVGSTGPMLIPGTDLLLGASKDGKLYVLNRNDLGEFRRNDDGQVVQTVPIGTRRLHVHGAPVTLRVGNRVFVYIMATEDHLRQFELVRGKLRPYRQSEITAPTDARPTPSGYTKPGGILSVSADGAEAGTGVVWVSTSRREDANQASVEGVLRAFDAEDVGRQLWSSDDVHDRDAFGLLAKYTPPTVAEGRVYMATFSQQFCVYGPLGGAL